MKLHPFKNHFQKPTKKKGFKVVFKLLHVNQIL